MTLNKLVDAFVWQTWTYKVPRGILRFLSLPIAFALMVATAPIWIPLAILLGIKDMWDEANR